MATTTTCKNCGTETFDTRMSPSICEYVCRKCYTSEIDAEHKRLKRALEHIIEYWNRDENPTAMSDALWHILETAEQALKG